jgi:uncharacterized BrkB/YihY/UPF0761 family membrane protein
MRRSEHVLGYFIWGILIAACFYLGAKLTFQIREKKKDKLHIDFEQAKDREKDGRL